VVNAGLAHVPDSATLLEKKKKVLSRISPNQGMARGPAQEFLESGIVITETESGQGDEYQPKNFIWIDKEYSYVSDLKQTWELTTLSYSRATPYGSLIGRYNYAYRFGTYGAQYELDAYPHLFSGAYLYMSYGYSQDTSIFPRNRTGLEAFFSLPESFEFSFGMRTLHFTTTTVLYTGSVAKYIGNYWIAYRPYIVAGVTNYFTFRRYFSTADSYMSLTLGTGYGENFYSLALPNTISPNKSTSIRLDGQLPVTDNLLFTWVAENSLNGFPNGLNRTESDLELGFIWRY
jgi:YaiO family outer membrane protein